MSLEPSAFIRRAAWTFAAAGLLCGLHGIHRACASEFEITADSFTVDKQVNLSSAAYFQGQASAPGNPATATQLASPGGLYYDGTYYNVWNSQTGAWVRVATGTVETGRVARAGDTMTGQLTLAGSTLTVTGNAFSVGVSTFIVTNGSVGVGTMSPERLVQLKGGTAGALTYLSSLQGVSGNLGTAIGIAFNPTDPTLTKGALVYEANGSGFERGDFQFLQQSNGDLNSATLANSVMTIANSGNVGIGTTGPTQGKLVVQGQQNSFPTIFVNDAGGNGQTGAVVDLEGNMASNPSLNRSLLLLRDTNPAGSDVGDSLLIRAFGTTTGGGGGTATTVFTVSRTGNVGIAANGGFCNVGGGNCVTVDNSNHLRPTSHNGMDLGDPTNTFSNLYVGNGIYLNGVAYTNPDYVFEPGYKLMAVDELRSFIAARKHLPHVPSTGDVKKNGVEIFEQNRVVLENLEEAYLYLFQMQDQLGAQQAQINALKAELERSRRR